MGRELFKTTGLAEEEGPTAVCIFISTDANERSCMPVHYYTTESTPMFNVSYAVKHVNV